MFNLFNTANRVNFQGLQSASTFMQAQSVLPAFRGQFGARFRF
jgi:hypothetical protein